MASILIGNTTSIIKQVGSEITISLTSLATITETYRGPYDLIVQQAPLIFSDHPYYQHTVLSEKKITREEGDIGLLSLKYEGLDPAYQGELPLPVYEFIRGNSSEPIDTHPNFDVAQTGYPGAIGGHSGASENSAYFDPASGIFVNFPTNAGNNLAGTQAYLAATMTFKKTYLDFSPPASLDLPLIQDPPSGAPFPHFTGGQTWLYLQQTWTRRGAVYEISQEWLASGPQGWNTYIYKTS